MVETLLEFLTAWGTTCDDAGFLSHYDFNGNCRIDVSDFLKLLQDFAAPEETSVARKA